MKKIGIAIVSIVLILGILVGILGVVSNGFKKFDFIKKNDPVIEKIVDETVDIVTRAIVVGDVLNGVYCNTIIEPNFEFLDWTKANVVLSKEDIDSLKVWNGFDEMSWFVLFSSCEPPTSSLDIIDFMIEEHSMAVFVIKYVVGNVVAYDLMDNAGNIMWFGNEASGGLVFGWNVGSSTKNYTRNNIDKEITYVNDQQDIWGNWVSKSSFVI